MVSEVSTFIFKISGEISSIAELEDVHHVVEIEQLVTPGETLGGNTGLPNHILMDTDDGLFDQLGVEPGCIAGPQYVDRGATFLL